MGMTLSELHRQLADYIDENELLKAEVEALRAELQATKIKVPTEEKRWFTTEEAAKLIGRSAVFLNKDRMQEHPKISFRKDSTRVVRYHIADLEAYIERRKSRRKAK